MPPITPISVLLVDDHEVLREGLYSMLNRESDFHVVAQATDGAEALQLAQLHTPAVVIMDLLLPRMNGFEAMRQIKGACPSSRFIVLSGYCEEEYVNRCLQIGAQGIVSKESSFETLKEALREVASGNSFMDSKIAENLKRNGDSVKTGVGVSGGLTKREFQVLRLIAFGAANKQVAADLGISIKTVEKHRQQLMDKLDIHDTATLTRYAISQGVIDPDITPKNHLD